MLFLTRAAVCIGLVALAASNASGGGLATALDRGTRDVAETAGRACLASSDCLRMGARLLAAAAPDGQPTPAQSAGPARLPSPAVRMHRRVEPSAARLQQARDPAL